MTLKVYGEAVHCADCGSDNTVEKSRWDEHGATYPVVRCLTCGWERSL